LCFSDGFNTTNSFLSGVKQSFLMLLGRKKPEKGHVLEREEEDAIPPPLFWIK